jgi:hypothetical protein
MRTVGYTTAPPRSVSPAGKWRLNVLIAATHGVCGLRCDRILWKSTVEPDPDPEEDESEGVHPKPRTRVGQFFANFKMRYRKGSYGSCASPEISNHGHDASIPSRDEVSTPSNSAPGSPLSTPVGGKDITLFSRFVTPERSASGIAQSSSVDNLDNADVDQTSGVGLLPSFPVDRAQLEGRSPPEHRGPPHAGATLAMSRPLFATPLPTESVPTTTTQKDDQAMIRNGPPRWRFLPFFRGDSNQTAAPVDPASTLGEPTEMTATYRPGKGDVVCLEYDSLDDKAMRRLEGRSDHRPVIGSFAIYL